MASDPATSALEDARQARQERADAFRAGVRAITPALIATGTWGMVTGVAMVKSG